MISPPCVAMRAETFAVSMLVPPPTATNPSKSPSTAKSAAAWKESSFGFDQLHDAARYVRLHDAWVGGEHHPPHTHLLQLPTSLFRSARAVLQRRGFHSEDGLVVRSRIVMHDELPFPREKCSILVPASFSRYTFW